MMDETLAKAVKNYGVTTERVTPKSESFHTKIYLSGNRALHVGKDSHIKVTTTDDGSPYRFVAKENLRQLICVLIEIEKSLGESA